MTRYLMQRLLLMPVTLLLLSMLIFGMLRTIPGDVVDFLFDEAGTSAEATLEHKIRAEYGLDRAIHIQYWDWLSHVVQGEFGHSFRYNKSATDVLKERFPRSLQLMVMGIIGAVGIGIPLGILSARHADSWIDHVTRVFAIGGLSTPSFVVAAVVLVILIALFDWIPPNFVSFTSDPIENLKITIFPAIVLAYVAAAPLMRLTRSELLEVVSQDYIRTARAKGLRERVVLVRHALKNAMLPIITVIGLLVERLISGSVIVELVFGVPGMGAALVDAVGNRDYPILQFLVIVIGTVILAANLLVDLAYAWLDPRVRYT